MEDSSHKTGVIIFFGVLLIIIAAGVTMWWLINNDASVKNADKVAQSQTVTIDANKPYSEQEVSEHGKPTNCWTIVDDKIYNLTTVIKNNPGIAELEQSCGRDGTAAINGKTFNTGQKDANGVAAPQSAADMLSKFQIGKFKQQ